MSTEEDQAKDTLLDWAGFRGMREIVASNIFGQRYAEIIKMTTTDDDKQKRMMSAIGASITWADALIKQCKETKPP